MLVVHIAAAGFFDLFHRTGKLRRILIRRFLCCFRLGLMFGTETVERNGSLAPPMPERTGAFC